MKYIVFGLTAIFLALCSKEVQLKQSPLDYLIFGHFYDHCIGKECLRIFKLTDESLYENTSDSYLATEFDFSPLGSEKYDLARNLKEALPASLLHSKEASLD